MATDSDGSVALLRAIGRWTLYGMLAAFMTFVTTILWAALGQPINLYHGIPLMFVTWWVLVAFWWRTRKNPG